VVGVEHLLVQQKTLQDLIQVIHKLIGKTKEEQVVQELLL
jgi:hypothetical protein